MLRNPTGIQFYANLKQYAYDKAQNFAQKKIFRSRKRRKRSRQFLQNTALTAEKLLRKASRTKEVKELYIATAHRVIVSDILADLITVDVDFCLFF